MDGLGAAQCYGMSQIALLPERAVLAVTGPDRVAFLQGLVSNDVALAAAGRAVWAALLSPQGKWLADFFIFADGERLLLDCEAVGADDLARRLSRFRLRSKVAVEREAMAVYAAWPTAVEGLGDALAAPDPRLPETGWRIVTRVALAETASRAAYNRHRLLLGLPDGSSDLEADKSVLLEAGFDELNGVSWSKGCYMGQELTARTKYRGLVKRRLLPVEVGGVVPEAGSPVLSQGVEVGQMRSGDGAVGLALLRLNAIEGPLACGGQVLRVRVPGWMRVPTEA